MACSLEGGWPLSVVFVGRVVGPLSVVFVGRVGGTKRIVIKIYFFSNFNIFITKCL